MDKVLVQLHLTLFDNYKSNFRWVSKDEEGGLDPDGLMSKINSLTEVNYYLRLKKMFNLYI